MHTIADVRPQHRRALAAASEVVARVRARDLSRPTPCAGWDLGTLLGHMIGQNDGFALAVSTGDADESDYAAPVIGPDEASEAWTRSVDRVVTAFDNSELEREVRLVEIDPYGNFPAGVVVGMHLLDTVIHTWDVAISLGEAYRPDDELVDIVAAQAERVPAGTARTRPGAAFAPVVGAPRSDPWLNALAMLGRSNPD